MKSLAEDASLLLALNNLPTVVLLADTSEKFKYARRYRSKPIDDARYAVKHGLGIGGA